MSMSIVSRYVSREVAKYYGIVLAMVVGIYGIVEFLEKIDDFLEAQLPMSRAFGFLLYKVPFIVAQITPVGILLSVLIVFGLMNKYNEIVALKSSGTSIYRLVRPVLMIGISLSVLLFLLSEMVVPITMEKANGIWLREVRNEAAVSSREKNIWIKGKQSIAHIRFYDRREKTIFGVTLSFFDKDYRLHKRVDAPAGSFRDGQWILRDAMVQRLNAGEEGYTTRHHDQWAVSLDLSPADLERVAKKSEEMGFIELLDYITKIESEGYDASLYRVDLHAKMAFPIVCILMAIIGVGIAMRGKLKEGLPVSISYGIVIAFLYHVCYSFCMSLGYGEALPPVVAAWSANLLFAFLGGFLLLNAE